MKNRRAPAFAMIEIILATAIVGGLAAAAMTLAGSSAGQKSRVANLARGRMLCRSLAEEISTRPVADWNDGGLELSIGLGSFSLKADSDGLSITVGAGDRSGFETIDEYDKYTESPPKAEDGTTLAGYTGWTRTVEVEAVRLGDPDVTDSSETGLRKVTVTASYAGKEIARTTFLRSSEWERIQP